MNAPNKLEMFFLPAGVKKVEVSTETKVKNAATFTIMNEDHTLGNILRMQLLADPEVIFAGYKMPHPLEHKILVTVRTTSHSSPQLAFRNALERLSDTTVTLQQQFAAALHLHRDRDTFMHM